MNLEMSWMFHIHILGENNRLMFLIPHSNQVAAVNIKNINNLTELKLNFWFEEPIPQFQCLLSQTKVLKNW